MKKMTLSSGLLRKIFLPLCLLICGTNQHADAATHPPERMTYQGYLVDADGTALGETEPANYDLIFSIWDEQSGGISKWSEQQTVTIDKGYFSVLLGEGSPTAGSSNLLSQAFAGNASSRFVEITVKGIGSGGDDTTIRPRLQLVSSPYAFMSTRAGKLTDQGADMVTVESGAGIHVNGTVTATEVKAHGAIPLGGIIMWSGAVNAIPAGWALCNGANQTPNLQDRFIVGAGSGYPVGALGGAPSVTLNITQMPNHNHGGATGGSSTDAYRPQKWPAYGKGGWTGGSWGNDISGAVHSHTITAQGGNQPHENRPPYYALAFIMRVE